MLEIFLVCILGILTWTDAKRNRIPNWLMLLAILVRFGFFLCCEDLSLVSAGRLLMDGLVLSLPLYLISWLMDSLLKKPSLGGGDIKLLFVTGLYLGGEQNLAMFFIAGIMALVYCALRGKRELPLGPAIAVASIIVLIFEKIIE